MRNPVVVLFSLLILIQSCRKEDKIESAPLALTVSVTHSVDDSLLQLNNFNYHNFAGNVYEVLNLKYYLSDFRFFNSDGSSVFDPQVILVDASRSSNLLRFEGLTAGKYNKITFLIGIDSARNIHNGLPNTTENENMSWPVAMGGGYHFLKMEGHYLKNNIETGYAIHLGKNKNLIAISINKPFEISESHKNQTLNMNINEWFVNPNIWNFETDPNYTMSDDAAMLKISQNGTTVFSLK